MFGGLRLVGSDGSETQIGGQLSGLLIAYLALRPGRVHSREELAALFWPESEAERASQSLRQCLSSARLILERERQRGELLIATRTSITLSSNDVRTDVDDYEQCLRSANNPQDPPDQIALLTRAAELYDGGLLPGYYHPAIVAEQERLAAVHRDTLRNLVLALQREGNIDEAAHHARNAVKLDPLDEEAHCALMSLFAEAGQPSAVRRQYRELERILRAELDTEPLASTRELADKLSDAAERNLAARRDGQSESFDMPESAVLSPSHPRAASHAPAIQLRRRRIVPILASVGGAVCMLGLLLVWSFGNGVRHTRTETPPPSGDSSLPPSRATILAADRKENPAKFVVTAPASKAVPSVPSVRSGVAVVRRSDPSRGAPRAGNANVTKKTGEMLWAAHNDLKPDDKGSEPKSMTTDAAGNIYVTGFVDTKTKNDTDYLTLKYSPEGNLLWERRYNGPGSDLDRAYSIGVDSGGNVYVTGESDKGTGSGPERLNGCDIATIKYDPDGHELWVKRYNGPANGRDAGWKLALDGAGNIYVFGQSWGGDPAFGGTGYDGVCIKYDASGAEKWVRRFPAIRFFHDLLKSMAVSRTGDVSLAFGITDSGGKTQIETRKYNAAGSLKWQRRSAIDSTPTCVASDEAGNVYVSGPMVTADDKQDISTRYGFVTVKYGADGTELWTRCHEGGDYMNCPSSLAVDPRGGLHVTGKKSGLNSQFETVKYASDGVEQWAWGYHGTGATPCEPWASAIDSTGRLYVTGRTSEREKSKPGLPWTSVYEFGAVAYTPNGRQERVLRCGEPEPSFPFGWATLIAVDRDDNVIVAGQSSVPGKPGEIVTVKYRSLPR